MAGRLIKSVFWLTGCTALGYGLLMICSPSENDLTAIQKDFPGVEKSPIESLKKKEQFVSVLQSASMSNQPLYRLNKEALDKELKKQ